MTEDDYKVFSARMQERFPKMYGGNYGGFAVGPGWWKLIEHLSHVIQSHIDQAQQRGDDCPQVVVEQVKEKFGSLRFYYQGGDDFIHGATVLAESLSGTLCEECGGIGKRTRGGWVRTLCDFHIAENEAMKGK